MRLSHHLSNHETDLPGPTVTQDSCYTVQSNKYSRLANMGQDYNNNNNTISIAP